MRAKERVYRATGGKLVPEGHPDAAFLAYAVGDDIAADDEAKLPGAKSHTPRENKLADKPEDKSGGNDEPKAADVRAWAEAEGLEVPKRGKLPDKVVDTYLKRKA